MLDSTIRKIQRDRERALKRAEHSDGYREGQFRDNTTGKLYTIDVTFYPSRKWWIEDAKKKRRPLTKDIWAMLKPVKE